jgi:hypothetical protein
MKLPVGPAEKSYAGIISQGMDEIHTNRYFKWARIKLVTYSVKKFKLVTNYAN